MEYKTVSPSDDGTCQRPVRKAIASYEQGRVGWQKPYVDEIQDRRVIAEIKKEVVPGALLVYVCAHWK